ncbi:hypothetical protein ACXC9Q_02445 [Kribbella sp. CWNU-51]
MITDVQAGTSPLLCGLEELIVVGRRGRRTGLVRTDGGGYARSPASASRCLLLVDEQDPSLGPRSDGDRPDVESGLTDRSCRRALHSQAEATI